MRAILAFFLSIFTLFASIGNSCIKITVPEDNTEFTPVMRFMAASDSHVGAAGDKLCKRVMNAIDLSYAIADTDKEYNDLDAVLFVGDVTNSGMKHQFCGFTAAVNASLRGDTEFLATVAKSHDSSTYKKDALEYFNSLTGIENNFDRVVNGYHIIGLSTSSIDGEHYSEYQRQWLKAHLDAAVKEDPSKPIFVAHHEHVKNTVYGSSDVDGWGTKYFKDIIEQYPQVVHISGHSHYPVNDPRSIWQGEFTAIGTGALKYLEFTVDDENKIHPEGNDEEAEFWLIEVDATNRIRLRAYDLIEEKLLCEYILNGVNSREYTPEKQLANSSAPQFNDKSFKLTTSSGKTTVKFERAYSTDGKPVVLYRAYILDNSGEVIDMIWKMPKYYSATLDRDIEIELGKLPENAAGIKIIAENAYGMQSNPINISL